MEPQEWLARLVLGGLAGMAGQGLRVIIGIKKTHDEAQAENENFKEKFDGAELMFSLLIGFVAGLLASMAITDPQQKISAEQVFGLMGAGYAGADFIEGFVKKYLPKTAAAPVAAAAPASPAALPPPVG